MTHYDAYFVDARAELRRLVDLLGIGATDETVERAVGSVSLACATVARVHAARGTAWSRPRT